MKQNLTTAGEIDKSIIIAGDFNTYLSVTDRTTRENSKGIKDVAKLSATLN